MLSHTVTLRQVCDNLNDDLVLHLPILRLVKEFVNVNLLQAVILQMLQLTHNFHN